MKRLLLPAVFGFGLLMLLGCVAYPYTYSRSVGYYGYAPSYDFNYGYQPYYRGYGYYGYRPYYWPYGYYGYQPYGYFGWSGRYYRGGHGHSHGDGLRWGGKHGGGGHSGGVRQGWGGIHGGSRGGHPGGGRQGRSGGHGRR